jgi:hypothetical protein
MTGGDDEGNRGQPAYKVGYRRPPPEHRFRKGVSGNPKGRPKGSKRREATFRVADEPTKSMILDEAYRTVTVREGENLVKLPMIQAVLRSMGVSALKGNRFAQIALTEIVQRVEDEHRANQFELFTTAVEYKDHSREVFERCDREGRPRPKMLPHPDDIEIDVRSGTARFAGPMTEEEEEVWRRGLELRDEYQQEFSFFRRMMKREPDNLFWRERALFEQKLFDRINNILPKRYKKELKARILVPPSERGKNDVAFSKRTR